MQMTGLGLTDFFCDGYNVFDLLVVAISLLEISLMQSGGDGSSLSALRTFRMLRIMKSARVLRMLRVFRCSTQHDAPACHPESRYAQPGVIAQQVSFPLRRLQ